MLLRFVVLVICVFCLSVTGALAAKPGTAQIDALVNTCIKLLQVEDFSGLAMMYHYPPSYSEQELAEDVDGVTNSLKIFSEEFGRFDRVAQIESKELYFNIYASGGSPEYWDGQQGVQSIALQTEFANFGPGYLVIHIADIMTVPEVKAIAYGLPVSGESVERIRNVGNRMLQLMEPGESLAE